MRRARALALLAVAALWAAPDAAVAERGLLWRVSQQGVAPSFVFGTIHLEDPRVLRLPAIVRESVEKSDTFVPEAVPDPAALLAVGQRLFLEDGRTLASIAGPALFEEAAALLGQQGLPSVVAERLQPWAATLILSVPRAQSGMFLDRQLYELARNGGKRIVALETLSEQIELFAGMQPSDQVALLRQAVGQFHRLPQRVEEITAAYLARDLGLLEELARNSMGDDPRLARTIGQRIVIDRNARMVERLLPLLREGSVFVAVGALHLPGPDGMLSLLREAGYGVSVVY